MTTFMDFSTVRRELETSWKQLLYDVGVPMVSPPHGTKRRILSEYAARYGTATLVETGTFMGDMVERMRGIFAHVHSIELSESLHRRAVARFAGVSNVHLHHGDSAAVLPGLLATVQVPCLFWLDAHYSGGPTARAASDTPIMAELTLLFRHAIRNHVILVDDARLFVGADGYPTLSDLREFVSTMRPDYDMTVKEDIIRLVPTGATQSTASAGKE
jgi:hypothetical protein